MYQEHFGLARELFRSNPEGESVYVGPQQLATIARLRKALATPDAIVAVTGPVGVGKSSIAGRALEEIAPERMIARIGRMRLGPDEVLELLLESFSVTRQPAGTIQRFAAFKRLLRDYAAEGTRPFIIVEDARRIGTDALLEIEALTAADTSGAAAANIILLGDSELDTLLADPGLARMKQRIRLRHTLAPFTESDTEGYLRRCVSLASGDFDNIFASGAVAALHACSGGIPRVLNNLCESVLAEATDCGERPVTAALVSAVASDVYGIEVMPGFTENSADEHDVGEDSKDTGPDVAGVALAAGAQAGNDDVITDAAPDPATSTGNGEIEAADTEAAGLIGDVETTDHSDPAPPVPDDTSAADSLESAAEAAEAPLDELAERRLAASSQPVRSHQDLPELGELLARIGATRPKAHSETAPQEDMPGTPPPTAVDSATEQAAMDATMDASPAAADAVTSDDEPESAELANAEPDDGRNAAAESLLEPEPEPEPEPEAAGEAEVGADAYIEPDFDEAKKYREATADVDAGGSQPVAAEDMGEPANVAETQALIEVDTDEETASPDATADVIGEAAPMIADDDTPEPVFVSDDDETVEAAILDEQELHSIDESLACNEIEEQHSGASGDDTPVPTTELHVAAANDEQEAVGAVDTPDKQESCADAADASPDFEVADIGELELALSRTNDVIEESDTFQDDARSATELPEITLDKELEQQKAPAPASNLSRWQEELALANGLEDISDVLAETVFGDKAFDELAARIARDPDPDQLDGLSLAEDSPLPAPVRTADAPEPEALATTAGQQERSGAWKFDMSVSRRFELVKELGRAQKEREINAHSMVEITLGEDGYPVDASQGPVPEPIETQIDTEITQSRLALKPEDIEKLAEEEAPPPEPEKESRGLFGLFRRSFK